LFYQGLDGDETLVGTPFDDTMLGGAGSDTMTGNAGNDRIDGGYGDDMLAGGTGNDTYLLAYNGGRDTVIEDGVAEPNAVHTIQLEEGIDSSKVKAIRVGDDLEVRLRATADMLVLKDFYLQPQSWQDGWAVSDAQGISQPLGGFVVEIPPSRETWLAEQKAAFADRRSQVFGANRRAEGFQSLGGDTYRQVIHSFAYSLRQSHTTTWTKSLAVEALTSDEASIVADAGISRGPEAFSSTTYQLGSPIASGADTGRFAATPSFGNGNSPSSTGFGKAGVGAQSIETGTTVTPIYMPQRSNLLRDQQSSDYSGSGGYENELDWTYGGQTMYPQGSTPPAGVATNPVTAIDDNVFIQEQLLLTDVVAGDSDNFIGGASSIIEAGAGNDVIALASPFLLLGPDWETPLGVARDSRGGSSLGGFADAGAGDDFVDGSKGEDAVAGGDGADSLDGHLGSDTYLYSANETGIDTLQDTGLGAFSYLEWYYRSQGIENWEERSLHANQWRVLLGEGRDTEYFDSKSEADQFAADNEFLVPFVDFIAPLPAAAVVSRNDTATLNQLTNLGVLDRDVVKFGPGLAIDDLALTVTVNAPTLQERPGQPWYDGGKLSIRWGAAGIDLDVPAVQFGFEGTDVLAAAREGFPESGEWGNYALGAGIEAFQFADGSGYSLEQVLQRATVQTANFAYLFHRGSGTQIISSDFLAIKFKDGIRKSDVAITHDGVDLVLTLNDGSAQGRIVGYYADPANVPAISGSFADGVLNSDDLLYAGLTMQGTSADDGLQAVDGFPNTLRGGAGNDVLAGGNGDDGLFGEQGNDFVQGGAGADDIEDALGSNVLDGGAGNDYLYEEGHAFVIGATGDDQVVNYGPDSIVAYNAGDGNDTILVGSPLTLSLGGGLTTADMSLSVEGWDLLLTAGAGSIRLSGGLGADPATWPPITLQMFGSVHEYDFNAVIADFRDALAADPTLTSFALEGSLQAHETSSSNTEAIGGALAWQYATTGTLAGLSSAQKFSVLADPGFGTAPQPISLQAENHAPMLANPIADQTAADGAAFSFTVPADTFSDPDAGDSLTYTATLAGGGALPSWLVFDPATQAFSGSPASADLGTFDVTVSVTDGGGLASSDTFAITVGPAPDQFIVGTDADDV
ncbi:MAG TPA: putative Ig domain-containing protein, partial [Hyphomicrobiaceae bacterium]|nr:putative Ig domain-containing protein [Hyphomicrobiaceae bacterium]